MSLVSSEQIQQSLGLVGAAASTKRLLHKITQLSRRFEECEQPEDQEAWFSNVVQVFDWCIGQEVGAAIGQAAMLINVESIWSNLPLIVRDKYNNDFHVFAEKRTGKAWTTLENHMRAVRTFFVDQLQPTDLVAVPKRDSAGAIIVDSARQPIVEYVRWDPTIISISKLVAISARTRAGKMTNRLWSITADPAASWETLQIALSEPDPSDPPTTSAGGGGYTGLQFYLVGTMLFCREENVNAFVGDLGLPAGDDDIAFGSSDTLRSRALRRLFVTLGVKTEEEDLNKALHRVGLQFYPKETA